MMILYEGLNTLKNKHPKSVSHITGIGFAFGLWIKSIDQRLNNNQACFMVMYKAFELGLYTMRLGSNWLRIEPQLNISNDDLQKGLKILDEALTAFENGQISTDCLKWML